MIYPKQFFSHTISLRQVPIVEPRQFKNGLHLVVIFLEQNSYFVKNSWKNLGKHSQFFGNASWKNK